MLRSVWEVREAYGLNTLLTQERSIPEHKANPSVSYFSIDFTDEYFKNFLKIDFPKNFVSSGNFLEI